MQKKKDFLFGLIASLLLPAFVMAVFVHLNYDGTRHIGFVIKELFRIGQLSALLAVGAVPNLLLFFFAMNRERWALGRGVLAATMFYGILVMVIKLC